jgi:hypothetical protein
MSDELQNAGTNKTNTFTEGMVKDTADIYLSDKVWTHAVNAINNTHVGETGTLSNESANFKTEEAPYTIIGAVHKTDTEWILFSTNDMDSEIGIYDERTSTYTQVVNDRCLGFKRSNIITGVCKENYDCTRSVYWQDGLNPDRVLNLSRVPYKIIGDSDPSECVTPIYSDELDCDALRLHPLVDQPCVTIRKGTGAGQLNNGSYIAVVAYSENGVRLTDYSAPSQPQALWEHVGIGGSLDVKITNLDTNFHEFELVIVAVINQQTIAKRIGYYSIDQSEIHLDIFGQDLPTVDLAQIPLKHIVYEKSDKIFELGGYMIRTGVTTQPQFNYQPLANNIRVNWHSVEYPKDYYWHGGNITGYMRDEVYSFFIRWVYNTGARSASYHIPGRPKNANDSIAVGSTPDKISANETERWQVYDTSTAGLATNTITKDGGLIVDGGQMGYWESTERYPNDKPEIWGSLCGEPIRHHKMPSNETTHIHKGNNIYILGVEFVNIQHPLDENANPIKDIVGYEILRGSREGNRTIVAKGVFNNIVQYDMNGNPPAGMKGCHQNYPYNDLRPDKFLTQNYASLDEGTSDYGRINGESDIDIFKDYLFSFHSPETNFVRPYLGGNHVKIYREERGYSVGAFEVPYKHPKNKFITNAVFGMSALVSVGIAALNAVGSSTTSGGQYIAAAPYGAGTVLTSEGSRQSGIASSIPDLVNASFLQSLGISSAGGTFATAAAVATVVLSSTYYLGQAMDLVLDIFYKMIPHRDYMLQYNSHAHYDSSAALSNSAVPSGIKPMYRRNIPSGLAKYIGSGVQDFSPTYRVNNVNRNKFVMVQTASSIPTPAFSDTTRQRLSDVRATNKPFENFSQPTSTYYGAIKVDFQNQYGQLTSIVQLPTDSCVLATTPNGLMRFRSGVIFGGDVYINRYTEKNPYYFFNSWLQGEPNGTEFNYRNYVNGPAPRYWIDTNKYDITDLNITLQNWHLNFVTPSDFHRLDNKDAFRGVFSVRNSYAYLFYNGVRDFYTESELNLAYRDYGEPDTEKFYDVYGGSFADLSTMFRSDKITSAIQYKYDLSLSSSKLFSNFASWGSILPRDYDPEIYSTCFEYYPKRAIYSLQHQSGLKRDNWRNYLPLNYKDFSGKISTIKALNAQGAIILFEDAEPVQFAGVDQLQTKSGTKFTIGDGGLFQQNMQSIVNADDSLEYGSCTSSRSAVNTPFGLFYISQKLGKIMHYTGGGLDEISRNGLKYWFTNHLPSKLLQAAGDYKLYDNPVFGIGCQAMYDQQFELVYFTKKDYIPLRDDLYYNDPTGIPYYMVEGIKNYVQFSNKEFFKPCSWTVSYDPKSKAWVSFHSWVPDLFIPAYSHFFTTKDNGIWKHNSMWNKYCEYYGVQYPWEVELPVITPGAITTLRSVEYWMDAYKYTNAGQDYKHILDYNFDTAIIHNSEQISGILKLNLKSKNNPGQQIQYPLVGLYGTDILVSKEENKYRFNTFWDVTNNRGEFNYNETPMWITSCNGYQRTINPSYINYNKSPFERKKFRHYGNRIVLRKNGVMDVKMILKLHTTKLLQSPR